MTTGNWIGIGLGAAAILVVIVVVIAGLGTSGTSRDERSYQLGYKDGSPDGMAGTLYGLGASSDQACQSAAEMHFAFSDGPFEGFNGLDYRDGCHDALPG